MCFSVGSMGLSICPSFVIVLFIISTDAYLDGLGLGKWLVVYPVILSETHIPCRTVFQRPYIYINLDPCMNRQNPYRSPYSKH